MFDRPNLLSRAHYVKDPQCRYASHLRSDYENTVLGIDLKNLPSLRIPEIQQMSKADEAG